MSDPQPIRIAITGGPGGGKTTAADMFRREFGARVTVVPEAATLIFSGGFPRCTDDASVRETQKAIFHLQHSLETVHSLNEPGQVLLCDRGSIDGAAYWPEGEDFFAAMGTSLDSEMERYHAIIYFESAAVGGLQIAGNNPARLENLEQAVALDQRLHSIYQRHSRFHFVPHNASFMAKITEGLAVISAIVASLDQ